MSLNNVTVSNGTDVCNLFASHFSSAYSTSSISSWKSNVTFGNDKLDNIHVSRDSILNYIKRLDLNKGAGPDGIPTVFISKCAPSLIVPLYEIYNKSLATGQFPKRWKVARIVPIPKDGKSNIISNYRPISILSNFAKVFEAVLCPHLQLYVRQSLTNNQHGFVEGRSTTTNLVTYHNTLIEAVDSGLQVDAIYTDLSKAFDRVCHKTLIQKLASYGICGSLLYWFTSYLQERSQYVVVKGFQSDSYISTSGVPQGSHLGPWLFNVFINDIADNIQHSKVFLYADDLKLARVIKDNYDSVLLQQDINQLYLWCLNNNMQLNINKCFHIKFTRNRTIFGTNYNINGCLLQEVDQIRDLGVYFDSKLTFLPHIDKIISKATRILGFVIRNCRVFKNPNTKIVIYNSFVRSVLEYCSNVWSPHYNTHQLRIERIQKRFLRHLVYCDKLGNKLKTYDAKLQHYKIDRLTVRRNLLDIIFLYKIVRNRVDCPPLLNLINLHVPRRAPRRHVALFQPPLARTNLKQFATVSRMCRNYNVLSKSVDIFNDSLNKFKRSVLRLLRTQS